MKVEWKIIDTLHGRRGHLLSSPFDLEDPQLLLGILNKIISEDLTINRFALITKLINMFTCIISSVMCIGDGKIVVK